MRFLSERRNSGHVELPHYSQIVTLYSSENVASERGHWRGLS